MDMIMLQEDRVINHPELVSIIRVINSKLGYFA